MVGEANRQANRSVTVATSKGLIWIINKFIFNQRIDTERRA
jgi:hypothetical protein